MKNAAPILLAVARVGNKRGYGHPIATTDHTMVLSGAKIGPSTSVGAS